MVHYLLGSYVDKNCSSSIISQVNSYTIPSVHSTAGLTLFYALRTKLQSPSLNPISMHKAIELQSLSLYLSMSLTLCPFSLIDISLYVWTGTSVCQTLSHYNTSYICSVPFRSHSLYRTLKLLQ